MSAADNPAVTPAGENGLSYASRTGRWVLLATVLGSALASIDATVVGIALPAIGRDFDAELAALQWVVTAYMLDAGRPAAGGRGAGRPVRAASGSS